MQSRSVYRWSLSLSLSLFLLLVTGFSGTVLARPTVPASSQPKANPAVTPGAKLWSYQTGGSIESSPVVDDGVVYAGSYDYSVYALDATSGAKLWSYQTGGSIESSPVVDDGVVYAGSYDGSVYALDAESGALLWSYQTGGRIEDSPVVVDGVVYTGSTDGAVYAINATSGELLWSYQTIYFIFSSPVVVNGVVYGGIGQDSLVALDATSGELLWSYQTGDHIEDSPVVVDGVVYTDSDDHSVYALDAESGELLWSYQTGSYIGNSPVVENGVVYAVSYDHSVYALDATSGALLWSYQTGDLITSSPVVVDGVVYTDSDDHSVYALDAESGTKLWSYQTGDLITSSPVVVNGVVYVGSYDGAVYALAAPPPHIQATPASVSLTTPIGSSPSLQTLVLSNTGEGTLTWTADALPAWVSVSPTSGTLAAGGSEGLTLLFNTPTAQTYTTDLTIRDLKADNSPVLVPITVISANVSKTWYFAEGYTGSAPSQGSFNEYLTLENPNNGTNIAHVTYLLDQGSEPVQKDYILAAYSRKTLLVNDEVGNGRNVSIVVTADQPIVAERPMYFTYGALPGYTIPGGTDVLGATSLSQQFDFGYIDTTPGHDPYLTFLNQNDAPMHVTIEYFAGAGGDPTTTTHTFAANSRGTINVRTDEGLPAGSYSALVSLDEPGLVERPMYLQDSVTGYTGSVDVVGVAQPQTDWYFAEGYTNTNFNERYYLSNPSTSQGAIVTVTFFLSDGTTRNANLTIRPGEQVVVAANSIVGQNVNNSAHVHADVPILAERFMSFDYTSAIGGNQHPDIPGATDVLGTNAPGNLFYFAEGYDGTGFAEYLTIENPSTTEAATVTVTFYPDNGSAPTVKTYTVAASSRFTLFTADVLPDAAFSMQVESNAPIVAERPMYFNYLNGGQTGGTDVVGYQP